MGVALVSKQSNERYDTMLIGTIKYEDHNYSVDQRDIENMLYLIRKDLPKLTDEEIVNKCLYHYGGTIASALFNWLYNHQLLP